MGLVYHPAESKELIDALEYNIQVAREIIEKLQRANKQLMTALDRKTLVGAAYNAGKGMFGELIIPTVNKTTEAVVMLTDQLNRYKMADNEVRNELLDEDLLNEELELFRQQEAELWRKIDYCELMMRRYVDNDKMQNLYVSYKDTYQTQKDLLPTLEENIRNTENKLRQLYDFNDTVNNVFEGSVCAFETMMSGMALIKNSVVDKQGGFSLKGTIDLTSRTYELTKAGIIGVVGKKQANDLFGSLRDANGKTRIWKDKNERILWGERFLNKENRIYILEESSYRKQLIMI